MCRTFGTHRVARLWSIAGNFHLRRGNEIPLKQKWSLENCANLLFSLLTALSYQFLRLQECIQEMKVLIQKSTS